MTKLKQLVMTDDPREIQQLERELGQTQAQAVDLVMEKRWVEFPAACYRLDEFTLEDKRRALLVRLTSEMRRASAAPRSS